MSMIPLERIQSKILVIRNQRVMIDRDLAELYGVETRTLNQSVQRNLDRFPDDFMFQLNDREFKDWKSQIVISNSKARMSLRKAPFAFTELGVAMLSSVLRSKQAVKTNVAIMRAFVDFRNIMMQHEQTTRVLVEFEKRMQQQDRKIDGVVEAIKEMMQPDEELIGQIGFKTLDSE